MELLLDTCTLLWALFDNKRISKEVGELLEDINNDIYVSAASLWEIAIKNSRRPDSMPYSLDEIFNVISNYTDFIILPIKPAHLFALKNVIKQGIHQDPFDHIMIATSQVENVRLVTCDTNILRYQGVELIPY